MTKALEVNAAYARYLRIKWNTRVRDQIKNKKQNTKCTKMKIDIKANNALNQETASQAELLKFQPNFQYEFQVFRLGDCKCSPNKHGTAFFMVVVVVAVGCHVNFGSCIWLLGRADYRVMGGVAAVHLTRRCQKRFAFHICIPKQHF